MEISSEVFDRICRACLNESPNMQPLLTKLKGDDRYLLEILASVANLDIKFEDTLPKQVCSECQATIYKADEFRRRCVESEALLTNLNSRSQYECHFSDNDEKNVIKSDLNITESSKPITENGIEDSIDRKDLVFSDFTCFTPDCNPNEPLQSKRDRLKDEPDIKIQYEEDLEAHGLFSHDFEDQMSILTHPIEGKSKHSKVRSKIYKCHCGMQFKSKDTQKRHTKKLNCDKLNRLIRKCLTKKPESMVFKCEICNRKFDTINAWNTHQNTHEIKVPNIKTENRELEYFCSECNRKFKSKKSLRSHIRRHEIKSKVTYTCKECKREFKYKAYLDNHILSLHTREEGFSCQYCAKSFATEESLNLHKEGHKVEKKHQCSVCNKAFLMLCTLKDHMRTHTGEKPFLCSICGKGFSQKNNLAQHMRRHQGLKPFKCETCQKGFVSKGELDAHERKHSGAHPFVCDDCNHGFTTSSALVKHRRIHTGERPYACDLCPMRFAASGTLKNHRRTHTGEKPFQCSYCDKAFVQKSDLISHIRCHTGERPYICTQCGHAFRKAAALKTHVRMHGKDGGLTMHVTGMLAGMPMQ